MLKKAPLASWTRDLIPALCSLLDCSRQVVNNVSGEEEKDRKPYSQGPNDCHSFAVLELEGTLGCRVPRPKEEVLFLEACVVCHLREWASSLAWI